MISSLRGMAQVCQVGVSSDTSCLGSKVWPVYRSGTICSALKL